MIDVRHADPFVTFTDEYRFDDGARSTSSSRLRYRRPAEIERDLVAAGLRLLEVRDAPDRPGLELVVLATAAGPRLSPGGS